MTAGPSGFGALPSWFEAMRHPAFYPHRPERVDLVQTHASYVFLAGEKVYKVKKPVRFSFLDFSTLELRRHFCEEEVRLNRRLTQDVYRGVVGICRREAGFSLGSADDPGAVEYAVEMRRLPAERMLARLLERGEATPEMLRRLAQKVAAFHEAADCGPEVRAFGSPQSFAASLEEDFAEAARFRGVTVEPRVDDAIRAFFRAALAEFRPWLEERCRTGRVREGHGDLHAEHVCFEDGIQIYDCIEFRRDFRCRDVAAEVAFLAMDLVYHGREDLAETFVAEYAERAGDADVARLWPFFACHRAYIRGKVESLASEEPEVGEEARSRARDSAVLHFRLAYRFTWAYRPVLVVVFGLSGSGKTTLARELARRTGFEHWNSDEVRKELAGLPPNEPSREEDRPWLYGPDMSARTYATLFERARAALGRGRGVILDATFQRRQERGEARALARDFGVPFVAVECRCSEATTYRRLGERVRAGAGPSDADWSVYLRQRSRYEPLTAGEGDADLCVDTERPLPELLARVESALERALARTRSVDA
ncbi:MAG: aminoglycoside phosphotransferase [Candidatus Binatia bacterium]|nr:MAG: aminoglycoside phosphotransferase [Candidatus Binatia bacterium]